MGNKIVDEAQVRESRFARLISKQNRLVFQIDLLLPTTKIERNKERTDVESNEIALLVPASGEAGCRLEEIRHSALLEAKSTATYYESSL